MSTARDHLVVVGSGFAGLGMGIRLKQAGIHDFTILEQADRVGGTWRDNHYPGAACDIESHLYSFSFEPNPTWTRTFANQGEILRYLDHCADKYGLRPHLRLGTAATGAIFDERDGTWEVQTSRGESIRARAVIAGCGGLSRPSYPDIPGLSTFAGKTMHSARWDDDYPLAGKTVACIGTGASAIQIVPSIAPIVKKLDVFQRTAPWIIPKRDFVIPPSTRAWFGRVPALQGLARLRQYLVHELMAVGFVARPQIMDWARRLPLKYLEKTVRDPVLRAKLTPDYTLGCKRILLSNDYYPAIQRENVELVTDPIERIEPEGVRTKNGTLHGADALILATGFEAAEVLSPFTVKGRGGRDLSAAWRDGAEAYLGTTIAGFPNLFLIVGPNTGLGHSSMVFMIESQIAYILDCIQMMRKRGIKSVDVRPEAQSEYNRSLQGRLAQTVWASGCKSWYQTRSGRNTTLWPGFTVEFRMRTRRFDVEQYELQPAD